MRGPRGWGAVISWFVVVFALTTALVLVVRTFLRHDGDPAEVGLLLRSWTLEAEGQAPSRLLLPVHLDDALRARPASYRLRAELTVGDALVDRDLDLVLPYLSSPRVVLVIAGREAVCTRDPWHHSYRSGGTFA